ncbi:UDP-glycosyltransferase UGT5-like [Ostrinia nubilalis]|uniref:UDP-glycosyltransferase UGT5-like n=1 Tax=Ostrinia nubilalis TaxID=29057 RepID=UPI0030826364
MKLPATIMTILTTIFINEVTPLNILGVFPYQGRSHFFVFEPYLRELAARGHNVTVITHFPQKTPVKNYQDISLVGTSIQVEGLIPVEKSYFTLFMIGVYLIGTGTDNCKALLANDNVQKLWKSEAKFDVVLVEQFNSDCSLGLAHKLGAPVIGLTSHTLMPWQLNRFGVEFNPSYVSTQFLSGGTKPSLFERIERVIVYNIFNTAFKYASQRTDESTLREYFDGVPPLEELAQNIRVQLVYTHHTLSGVNLYPPKIVEVNGYHVAKPKPLPEKLQKFIDEAEHGVIYVSFGSMLKAASTPRDKLEAITKALSQLPQRVIFKWEEKTLPGDYKNIYISDWLPQNDIFAHPNVVAFYSHCGLLGTTEAIYHGVPIVGMPIFGDQPSNAAAMEEGGMGVQIQTTELTTEKLLEKFKIVLDPQFRANVKRLSKVWHDRPSSPMDTAIYWTEYVARNPNFTFVPPTVHVPFYQFWCLDVLAVFILISLISFYVLKFLCCLVCRRKSKEVVKNANTKKKSKKDN